MKRFRYIKLLALCLALLLPATGFAEAPGEVVEEIGDVTLYDLAVQAGHHLVHLFAELIVF